MILFVGCSYTWGSGLQYEHLSKEGWTTDELNKVLPYNYHLELLDYEADEYRKQHNWPNLVSKQLNKSFVIPTYSNGGSNLSTILPALQCVDRISRANSITTIVVQFTDWLRDCGDNELVKYPGNKLDITTQDYIDSQISLQIKQISDLCNGIFTRIDANHQDISKSNYPNWVGLSWRDDIGEYLKKHYPKNFIPIHYKGKEYTSFGKIDNGLRLCDTIEGLDDQHLNSNGCKVIADSIIKKLKKYETKSN
tara:strand:- start:372 stop:1124 length:753 start_codon:yes stop_codon:yes gene_type:complete